MANNSKLVAKLTSPIALLLFATALAGGVAFLAYFYLQQREESIKVELTNSSRKKATPKVSVVVPKANVGVNTILNGTMFVSRSIEEDLVYPDTLLAKDFPSMEGQKLARPVLGGRPVRLTDLQQPEVNNVAALLPPGTRAMTIDIDNINSIAQTLRPHHHIDIFLLSKAPKPLNSSSATDEKSLEQVSLFMQDMVILATGKEFQDVNAPVEQTDKMVRPGDVEGVREKGFDTITLLVNPREAAKLLVGQKMGTFRVVLRGDKDRDALAMKPLKAGDLIPASAKGRDVGIEFIVGGRGDHIVSKLDLLPSQVPAQTLTGSLTGYNPPAQVSDAPQPDARQIDPRFMGIYGTSSAANQPIPALRGNK
ncbi:pilus assembly protein CpaB [Undibacterium sp. GrIS 1.8]|uniref:Flp pilus assembly protein CpaB n=1 Tax=Undibacterium sp. GrIS 1.8 TaxID=3143934 RepID=UPI003393D566